MLVLVSCKIHPLYYTAATKPLIKYSATVTAYVFGGLGSGNIFLFI